MNARLTVVTLGVDDMKRSIAFYEAMGFQRRMAATGEDVAFFAAGGCVIALFPWDKLAEDANLPEMPRPKAFRGVTLAWNCATPDEVDETFARVMAVGGVALKRPQPTFYGGYCGYFADPDGHHWEIVQAPGIDVTADGRVELPD